MERNIYQLPLALDPNRDLTGNPGMYPDQKSNGGLFALQGLAKVNQLSHTHQVKIHRFLKVTLEEDDV